MSSTTGSIVHWNIPFATQAAYIWGSVISADKTATTVSLTGKYIWDMTSVTVTVGPWATEAGSAAGNIVTQSGSFQAVYESSTQYTQYYERFGGPYVIWNQTMTNTVQCSIQDAAAVACTTTATKVDSDPTAYTDPPVINAMATTAFTAPTPTVKSTSTAFYTAGSGTQQDNGMVPLAINVTAGVQSLSHAGHNTVNMGGLLGLITIAAAFLFL